MLGRHLAQHDVEEEAENYLARLMQAPPAPPGRPPVWKEYFVYTAEFTGTKALAAGTADGAPTAQRFDDFNIRIDSDSDFEFIKSMYVATDPRVYVRYADGTSGRQLHRGSLDLRFVAGQGFNPTTPTEARWFLPFIWPQPYVISASSVFIVSGADFSGATNTVRLSFHGNKIRPGHAPYTHHPDGRKRVYRAKVPFVYPLPPDGESFSVGASATLPISVPIDMEADWLVYKLTLQRTGIALATLQDGSGRERQWMDRAVHVDNLGGSGQFPNVLTAPRYIPRGSSINGFITDLSVLTNRVRLYLHGVKLYEA